MSKATYDDWDEGDFDYEADDISNLDDDDYCYECGGYGDDYFINDDGELESACPTCPHNRYRDDHDWDDDWDD